MTFREGFLFKFYFVLVRTAHSLSFANKKKIHDVSTTVERMSNENAEVRIMMLVEDKLPAKHKKNLPQNGIFFSKHLLFGTYFSLACFFK